ncbi:MAG: hypothetical protein WAS05_09405 [Candidatus Nanopelagicales bacterium]
MSDINNPGGNEVPENQPPAAPPPPSAGSAGGTPPPPPPAPENQGGASESFSIGNAFNWGWKKFQENLGPLVVGGLIAAVIYFILALIVGGIASALAGPSTSEVRYDPATGALTSVEINSGAGIGVLLVIVVGYIVISVFSLLVAAGFVKGALAIASGKKIEFKDLLPGDNASTVVIAGIIVGILTAIGTVLCIIPGLVVAFYSLYYIYFIQDKGLGAIDGIKASWSFVNKYIGSLFGVFLASFLVLFCCVVISIVFSLLPIIGSLIGAIVAAVASLVLLLVHVYAYRTLNNEEVSA